MKLKWLFATATFVGKKFAGNKRRIWGHSRHAGKLRCSNNAIFADSFKAGSKFRAAFRSSRSGTARGSVSSTPMNGIAVLDFVRRWWSISLRRTAELLWREVPVSFAASGSSFLSARSSWIILVEIRSFESVTPVGRGSSFYPERNPSCTFLACFTRTETCIAVAKLYSWHVYILMICYLRHQWFLSKLVWAFFFFFFFFFFYIFSFAFSGIGNFIFCSTIQVF